MEPEGYGSSENHLGEAWRGQEADENEASRLVESKKMEQRKRKRCWVR